VGWHRIYLLEFESALRIAYPWVCLPYWDSRIDSLNDLERSPLWTREYFGNARGEVYEGPFAGWKDFNNNPLVRDVQDRYPGSSTFTYHEIYRLLSDASDAKSDGDVIKVLHKLEGWFYSYNFI